MTKPMPTESPMSEIEKRVKALTAMLTLPDSVCQPGTASDFRHFDLAFARSLFETEDAFVESRRIYDDLLLKSGEGRALYAASELDLLSRVAEQRHDFVHAGPFGLCEAIFPLVVHGHVIHIIRSGPYRQQPLSAPDLKEMAFLSAVPLDQAQAVAATLPRIDAAALDQWKRSFQNLRDVAALAINEHLRAARLSAQALQSERLNALGSLAEGMAHHFNNLLSIILGYSSLLLDRDQTDERSVEALGKIADAAQRGRRFTEEVLNVAGLVGDEEDKLLSVHERIESVLSLLRSKLGREYDMKVELNAATDTVLAPSSVVHQIVYNLIANALNSMPTGGVLHLRTETIPAESGEPERIHLTVTDSGEAQGQPGHAISPARRTLVEQDLGPKLASVLGMVARLDGSIKVTGSASMGSSVDIILPVGKDVPDLRQAKAIRKHLAPSRIWVADDDATVREMCRQVLSEGGHHVDDLESGEDLKTRLSGDLDEPPELLIYDFNMPDLSGSEFVSWLREDANRKIPVVLISGFTPEHPGIKAALKFRKTFLLNKPFTMREMADQVTVALGETLIGE